jgi:sodium/potassium-transporting ATPase subunit alpha
VSCKRPPLFSFLTVSCLQTVKSIGFAKSVYDAADVKKRLEGKSFASVATLKALRIVAGLCNAAQYVEASSSDEKSSVSGNPTDVALFNLCNILDLSAHEDKDTDKPSSYAKLFNIPFNSVNKWMLSIVRPPSLDGRLAEPLLLVKGAPDILLPACSKYLAEDGSVLPLDFETLAELNRVQASWSSEGQRLIVLCMKGLGGVTLKLDAPNELEETLYDEVDELIFVGLVGLSDPPRQNIADALRTIRRAGVRVFMVTGDFMLTALAIAKQVGPFYACTVHQFN